MPIYSNMPDSLYPRPNDINAPLRSTIGIGPRGPKGHSITAEVIDTDPYGYFRVQFKDAETNEVLVTTPNLDVGSRFFVCNGFFTDVSVGSQQSATVTSFSTLQASSDRSAIRVGDLVFFTVRTMDRTFVSLDTIAIGVVNSVNGTNVSFITTNVMSARIADGGVTTDMLADLCVTAAKLADSAVTTRSIANLNVTEDKIAPSAVTTDKIGNSAVTTAKINDEAVTSSKLGPSSVITSKLADNSITPAKFNSEINQHLNDLAEQEVYEYLEDHPERVIPSDEQAEEVITEWLNQHPEATTTVLDGAISTAKLADGSVTDAKLVQSGGVLEEVDNLESAIEENYNREFDRNVIRPENTEMFDIGVNKYNPDIKSFVGKLKNDGTINATAQNYLTTDYIDISIYEGAYFIAQVGNNIESYAIAFYDDALIVLGVTTNQKIETALTIPSGTKYVRVSYSASTSDTSKMIFVSDTTDAETFKHYKATIKEKYNEHVNEEISEINSKFIVSGLTTRNVMLGKSAGHKITTGTTNTAVGESSLYNNTTGSRNTAVGVSAGGTITTGSENTLVGYDAKTDTDNNSAGVAVGKESRTGVASVAVGSSAKAIGAYTTAIGFEAEATASRGTAIGRAAKANYAGSVAIGIDSNGNSAAASENNEFLLGTSNHRVKIPGNQYDGKFKASRPIPTYGPELVSDLSSWTGTNATYSGGKWIVTEGGTISGDIACEANADYLIKLTCSDSATPNDTLKPCTITLGADSISIFGANDANWQVILTAASTGNLTVTIGGGQWYGKISSVSIKKITAYANAAINMQDKYIAMPTTSVVVGDGFTKQGVVDAANVAIGRYAQQNTQSGVGNVGIGFYAQQSIKNGAYNVGIGHGAQRELTTGMYNFGIGYSAHRHLTTGCWNVALGNETSRDLTDGCNNVSIGRRAHNSMTHGNKNVAIGAQAGFARYVNGGTIPNVATVSASDQVLIGFQATQKSTDADRLVAIGSGANGEENGTALGYGTVAGGAGSVAIGCDSSGNSAVAANANDFVLGTSNHRFILGGRVIVFNSDGTVTWE